MFGGWRLLRTSFLRDYCLLIAIAEAVGSVLAAALAPTLEGQRCKNMHRLGPLRIAKARG